jgi:hypothetical protein
MLLAIRACANLLLREMSIRRVGALCYARAFWMVSIREAYSFPSLLLCWFHCIKAHSEAVERARKSSCSCKNSDSALSCSHVVKAGPCAA